MYFLGRASSWPDKTTIYLVDGQNESVGVESVSRTRRPLPHAQQHQIWHWAIVCAKWWGRRLRWPGWPTSGPRRRPPRWTLRIGSGPWPWTNLSPDRRNPHLLAVLLFKSRLKQVPVFHPDDDRPGTSTEGASRRRAAGHGKCGRESFFCRRVVCATGRGRPSCWRRRVAALVLGKMPPTSRWRDRPDGEPGRCLATDALVELEGMSKMPYWAVWLLYHLVARPKIKNLEKPPEKKRKKEMKDAEEDGILHLASASCKFQTDSIT